MSNLKGCFSHESDHWKTPSFLYDHFMDLGYIDPCPFHSDFDGLVVDYKDSKLFINPPYSDLLTWCNYALRQFSLGNEVVLLIPARTDTKAFHLLLKANPEIVFIKGRLHFNDSKKSAPFPSLLVILKKGSSHPWTTINEMREFFYNLDMQEK